MASTPTSVLVTEDESIFSLEKSNARAATTLGSVSPRCPNASASGSGSGSGGGGGGGGGADQPVFEIQDAPLCRFVRVTTIRPRPGHALAGKVLEAIQSGRVPYFPAARTSGGPGTGKCCAICGRAVKLNEMEYQLDFEREATQWTLHTHVPCALAWERELGS